MGRVLDYTYNLVVQGGRGMEIKKRRRKDKFSSSPFTRLFKENLKTKNGFAVT